MTTFYQGETATITVTYTGTTLATEVLWTIKRPDTSTTTIGPNAISPSSTAATLSANETTMLGEYIVQATFTLTDSTTRIGTATYAVIDPLAINIPTEQQQTVDLAWTLIGDCFDSELGGPHLRDVSLANFDKNRLFDLYDLALYSINTMQPAQTFDAVSFPYAYARPLLAKSLEIEAIKHLMRSYVEQEQITTSGSITYFERRDYLDRWNTILTIEQTQFKEWIAMFKRQQYHFGTGKLLIDNKTRGLYVPQIRTRYPRGPIYGW